MPSASGAVEVVVAAAVDEVVGAVLVVDGVVVVVVAGVVVVVAFPPSVPQAAARSASVTRAARVPVLGLISGSSEIAPAVHRVVGPARAGRLWGSRSEVR
jgi:hypothetical protein